MSSHAEQVVYRAASEDDCIPANKWLKITREGSVFPWAEGRSVEYAVENFSRKAIWSAKFEDGGPKVTCVVHSPGDLTSHEVQSGTRLPKDFLREARSVWLRDDEYIALRPTPSKTAKGDEYSHVRIANWTMTHSAKLTCSSRGEGLGVPLKLSVYVAGVSVASYYPDVSGKRFAKRFKKDVTHYVETVQFALLNAETGATIERYGPHHHAFAVPGDARPVRRDSKTFSCFCYNVIQAGGWGSKRPLVVSTLPGLDPLLALLLAHMAHKEFSLPNIKAAVSPAFPDDPTAKDDNEVPLDPERMRAAFSVFDTDGDGKLSEADVERILTMKVDGHTPLTKVQVARLLAKYGGHQGINCEDLVVAWTPPKPQAQTSTQMI